MAGKEELRLKFVVDKDGVINVEQLAASFRKVKDDVEGANSSLAKIRDRLDLVIGAAGIGIAAAGISSLLGAVRSLGEALGEIDDIVGTQKWVGQLALQAGMAREEYIGLLRAATGGEMADRQLDQMATRFDEVGISAANSAAMVAFAFSKQETEGRKMEGSLAAMQAFVAAGQDKALKKMGVFIDTVALYEAAARKAGVPVKALTDEQQRLARETALVDVAAGRATPSVAGLGTAYDQAAATAQNFKDATLAALSGVKGWQDTGAFVGLFQMGGIDEQLRAMPQVLDAAVQKVKEANAEIAALEEERTSAGTSRNRAIQIQAQQQEVYRTIQGITEQIGVVQDLVAEKAWATLSDMNEGLANIGKITAAEWAKSGGEVAKSAEAMRTNAATMMQMAEAALLASAWMPRLAPDLDKLASALARASRAQSEQAARLKEIEGAMAANGDQVRIWTEELARAEIADPFGAQTVRLKELVEAAKTAQGPLLALAADLRALLPKQGQEMALAQRLTGDVGELDRTAASLKWVATYTKQFEEALKSGDMADRETAFANLARATEALQLRIQAIGGPMELVNTQVSALEAGLYDAIQAMYSMEDASATSFGGLVASVKNAYYATVPLLEAWWKQVANVKEASKSEKDDKSKPVIDVARNAGGGGKAKPGIDPAREANALRWARESMEMEVLQRKREAAAEQARELAELAKSLEEERRDAALEAQRADGESILKLQEVAFQHAVYFGAMTETEAKLAMLRQEAAMQTGTIWDAESLRLQMSMEEHRLWSETVSGYVQGVSDALMIAANAGQFLGESGSTWGGRIARSATDASKATAMFAKAMSAQGAEQGALAAGGIVASAQLATAYIENTKTKAYVLGGFEAAASVASFATGDIIGGTGHAIASGMYFGLAGSGSGGGVSSGVGGSVGGGMGTSAPVQMQQQGPTKVEVSVQGVIYGSPAEAADQLARMLNAGAKSGTRLHRALVGG